MYVDKLDHKVNQYNNTYHSTIKLKPVDVKCSTYIAFDKKNNKEGPKLVIMIEYQNIKIFLQNVTLQIGLKKTFVTKKVKTTVPWT